MRALQNVEQEHRLETVSASEALESSCHPQFLLPLWEKVPDRAEEETQAKPAASALIEGSSSVTASLELEDQPLRSTPNPPRRRVDLSHKGRGVLPLR